MEAIKIDGFTKKYKGAAKPSVNNIKFNVMPGQIHAFIGSNGAGKTTTIKSIIGGYTKKNYKGEIKIFGLDNESLEAKDKIGYIPEDAVFPNNLNLKEYLISMALFNINNLKEAKNKSEEVIKDLKLENMAKRNPNSFSSGEKKRVLLAQALLNNPQVLILDEPAANLDPKNRIALYENFVAIKKKGVAIFLSSHILSELSEYADSLTIIEKGEIKYSGSIKDFDTNISNVHIETKQKDEVMYICQSLNLKYELKNEEIIIKTEVDNLQKLKMALLDKKIVLDKFVNMKKSIESIYREVVGHES